jgi:large subunit ribosomal protein L29
MKRSNLGQMTALELQRKEAELREEIFRLRFQHHTGQLASPIKLRTTRRELAQVLTRARELELGMGAQSAGEE